MAPKEILVIFKTHLDVGYTDFSANVVRKYMEGFIPMALDVAEEMENDGDMKFVWTTGAWLISHFLETAPEEQRARMKRAISKGLMSWHALPVTMHIETMSRDLLDYSFSYSEKMDAEFGIRTIAAKITDVPGVTRAMIPSLRAHGVQMLHIGVNPASSVPKVPKICRWRAADGQEIALIYNRGYGEYTEIGDKAVWFAHTNDNLGPQKPEAVREMYRDLQKKFPEAKIRAATLNDVADAMMEVWDELPVVTDEIGDSWAYGYAADPGKESVFRALVRESEKWPEEQKKRAYFGMMMTAEHTCGLCGITGLADNDHYIRSEFEAHRDTLNYKKVETSWLEQRMYCADAIDALDEPYRTQAKKAAAEYKREKPDLSGWTKGDGVITVGNWKVGFDETGAINLLSNGVRKFADDDHVIGKFQYELFSKAECDRFHSQYIIDPQPWSYDDFHKLGVEKAIDAYKNYGAKLTGVYQRENRVLAMLEMPAYPYRWYGCPPAAALEVAFDGDEAKLDFYWWDKPANRVPEAIWLRMNPLHEGGVLVRKLGEWIDPEKVVENGGRALHGTDLGVKFGEVEIDTLDTALVGVGDGGVYNFDNKLPDLTKGVRFCLYDNQWNTNFPFWYDENARFRFVIK